MVKGVNQGSRPSSNRFNNAMPNTQNPNSKAPPRRKIVSPSRVKPGAKKEEVRFNVPDVEPGSAKAIARNAQDSQKKNLDEKNASDKINKNLVQGEEEKNQTQKESTPLEKVKIKKIGVLSFALTLAIINVFIGFILGLITFIVSYLVPLGDRIPLGIFGTVFGWPSIIIQPVLLGISGFLSGVFIALFYNLASMILGGIELYS